MPDEKKIHKRNTERILVSLYPDDLRMLDEIAERIKEPGAEINRSLTIRHCIREARQFLKGRR